MSDETGTPIALRVPQEIVAGTLRQAVLPAEILALPEAEALRPLAMEVADRVAEVANNWFIRLATTREKIVLLPHCFCF
jgi:hypothetical protein